MADSADKPFQFEISLSVLNHLGRNLYRNFITVLGEAISNAWDADAENVHIIVSGKSGDFIIKDDGIGMNPSDFQNKFLKIGYSKRKDGGTQLSDKKRPFIGAKGIGKLALLSCSDVVSIISRKSADDEYTGGTIDNSALDKAISKEEGASQYALGSVNMKRYRPFLDDHGNGTIIDFIATKEDLYGSESQLRKLIALYFRFSLVDESFNIFFNGKKVTLDDLNDLSKATQFIWSINKFYDPLFASFKNLDSEKIDVASSLKLKGFIASVKLPRNLKIQGTDEKIGIDLFVNGRLREKDIMKHVPTARLTESYLYGQIHFDELDGDGIDRFTSSREGIVASDTKYQEFLVEMKKNIIPKILAQWDELRRGLGEDGDDDAGVKTEKERRAARLFQLSAQDYASGATGKNKDAVDRWIDSLRPDAEFNIPCYADCFLSENLIRKYITEKRVPLTPPAQKEIGEWKLREQQRMQEANISFSIRRDNDDLSYLGMDFLAKVVDGGGTSGSTASLVRDAIEYKPIRNAVGHTGVLSDNAKAKLTLVYENIKGRLRTLLR